MVAMTKKPEPADAGTTTPPAAGGVESLDDLATEAQQLETPPATVPPGAPGAAAAPATSAQDAAEIASALELLRVAALPFAPGHVQQPLQQIWNDQQLRKIAEAIVAVCGMHGVTVGDFFGKYGPYIQLAMAVGLPALTTIKVLKLPPPPPADGQQQSA